MKKLITLCIATATLAGAAVADNAGGFSFNGMMPRKGISQSPKKGAEQRPLMEEFKFDPSSVESTTVANPIKKATMRGNNLYGFLLYSSTLQDKGPYGLYEFRNNTYQLCWQDPENININPLMTFVAGWLEDGKIKGYSLLPMLDKIFGYEFVEYDMKTGQITNAFRVPSNQIAGMQSAFLIAACDTEKDIIYGYGFHEDAPDALCFMTSTQEDPLNANLVGKFSDPTMQPISMTFNPESKKLVGVLANGSFIEIDPATGSQTKAFDMSSVTGALASQYMTGLVWNPKVKAYEWNINTAQGRSMMGLIDPEKKNVSVYMNLGGEEQFSALFTQDEAYVPENPATPEVVSVNFPGGKMSGNVVFKLPTKTQGGTDLSGNLAYTSYLDGAIYSNGTGTPGQQVSVDYTVSSGSHQFALEVKAADKTSNRATIREFIGDDTPATPENVVLTEDKVSWEAVTRGIHNGYMDAAKVEYEVFINGESKGIVSETSMPLKLGGDNPLSPYRAMVIAYNSGIASNPSYSNGIIAGKPFDIPCEWAPTPEQANLCSTVNTNSDGSWSYKEGANGSNGSFVCGGLWGDEGKMNSWLFLPAFRIEDADRFYSFSFDARARYSGFTEVLDVVVCSEPKLEGVAGTVIQEFNPTVNYDTYQGNIKVDKPGRYYVAVRCLSGGGKEGCEIRNFKIEDNNVTPESPAKVTDIKATAAMYGQLQATVAFRLPTQKLNGEAYPADHTLKAVITGEAEIQVEGKPGDRVFETVLTKQGDNNISIYAVDVELKGAVASVRVYTGVDVPARVNNLRRVEAADMSGLLLTWDAPTVGVNGGYIDPTKLTYDIFMRDSQSPGTGWTPFESGITECQYEYRDNIGTQRIVTLGVASVNIAGSYNLLAPTQGIVGKPYDLPMEETFDGENGLAIGPWLNMAPNSSYTATLTVQTYSNFNPEGSANDRGLCVTGAAGSKGMVALPRFSTEGEKSVSLVLTYFDGPNLPEVTLIAACNNTPDKTFGTIKGTNTGLLKTVAFEIPAEYLEKFWADILIDVNFTGAEQSFFISKVAVGDISGVENTEMTPAGKVMPTEGGIRILGCNDAEAVVCDLLGRPIFSGRLHGHDNVIPAAAGIYTVRAGALKAKVIVK